jgi:hypothetical protein
VLHVEGIFQVDVEIEIEVEDVIADIRDHPRTRYGRAILECVVVGQIHDAVAVVIAGRGSKRAAGVASLKRHDIREVAVFILVEVERNRPLLTLRFRARDTVGIVEVMKDEPMIRHVGRGGTRVEPKYRGGAHADCGHQRERKQCPHSHISSG